MRGRHVRVVWIMVAILSTAGAAWAAPVAVQSHDKLDLGTIKPGAVVKRTASIKNEGDEPLVLGESKSSCPCASILPIPDDRKAVAPGKSVDLTIRYDSEDRLGPASATVFMATNDPKLPFVFFDLSVTIEVFVAVDPSGGLFFGYTPRGYPLKKVLSMYPGTAKKDVEVLEVSVEAEGVTVHTKYKERDRLQAAELHLTIGPEVSLGLLDTRIVARVKSGDKEKLMRIPLRGGILGDILLTPASIVSPRSSRPQNTPISEITVRSSRYREGVEPPQVIAALVEGPLKTTIINETGEPKRTIKVDVAANAQGGPQGGVVYVITTSEDEPIIAVPVFFRTKYPVVAHPARVVLSSATQQETGQVVEIRSTGPFDIKDVRFDPALVHVDVETRSQAAEDKPAVLRIRAAGGSTGKKAATLVAVETTFPGGDALQIPVAIKALASE